ncbi:MAG: hypothetical protein GWP05_06715 [Anaerolineaceae bacterium]|nr:hypothetical protein [Anaerolineaceae bacterium]
MRTDARPAPAASPEAYRQLETVLYQVRDALEAAESFHQFSELLAARNVPQNRVIQVTDLSIGGDLHLHSSASDGKIPARKLPWLARVMGLRTISITDHDSVSGCREAFREGMLIGVRVVCGLELSTQQPGLEILAYFPDAGKLFSYLQSSKSSRFRRVLGRRQSQIHDKSLACLDYVNAWLGRQKVAAEDLVTLAEYDRWFGGRKPYFPGTLCVLALERLTAAQRDKLKIHDPRTFNTKVVTRFLRSYGMKSKPSGKKTAKPPPDLLAEDFSILRSVARAGVPVATILAHPKELVTKGKKSLGAAAKLIMELARQGDLDGIEVACSRDTEDDIRYWKEIVDQYNASLAQKPTRRGKPLLAASHSSDFHVLGPGLETGEITLGFGVLDSRPQFRRGNLHPQMPLEEFLEQLQRRANENARS